MRTKLALLTLLFGLAASTGVAQEIVLAASEVARTLNLEMREKSKKSIAVSTFRDLQGDMTPVGAFFAEELFNQLVAHKQDGITIVERSRTDAVFAEQKLGIDGLRESGKLDAFVKILKVDALVVGTISTIPELEGRMRINARLIAVPGGEALASASAFARIEGLPQDLPTVPPPPPPTSGPIARYELRNVVYELMECTQETRLIVCQFIVTNNGADKFMKFFISYNDRSYLYDQGANQFHVTRITIADVDSSSGSADKFLITEIPMSMKVYFEGVPSSIEFIKILHINTSDGIFELRDIRFSN